MERNDEGEVEERTKNKVAETAAAASKVRSLTKSMARVPYNSWVMPPIGMAVIDCKAVEMEYM